jgi:membrane protein
MNLVQRAVRAADQLQQRHAWLAVPVAVWKKFGDDHAGNLAALVAYYAFVAIFPLLLVLVTVLDIVLKNDSGLRQRVLNAALTQYPVVGPDLEHSIGRLHETGFALVIGLLGTFFGARGVANALQNALNSAWEIPFDRRPHFPWSWLRSFALMFVIGVGFIVTTSLTTLAGSAGRVLPGAGAHVLAVRVGAHVLAVAVSLVLNFGLFWLGFRLATARQVTWKELRLGAVMSAIVWQVLQTFGGYFLSHQLAHASPLYGTFALVLGLIAWFYLQAELTLYAVEVNVVRAYRLWPRSIAPPPYTEQDRRAYELYADVEKRRKQEDIMVEVPGAAGGEDDRETTSG